MKHTLQYKELANKAKITSIIVPDSSIVEAHIVFRAGFEYFEAESFHVPHLLEHLLVGNSNRFKSDDDFLHALQEIGADINASTDYQSITVMLRAPRDNFISAFRIAFECIFDMRLSEEALEEQKHIVIREIHEQFDSLGGQVLNNSLAIAFPSITPDDWSYHEDYVNHLTLTSIEKAYNRFIRADNMQVILAGNIKEAELDEIYDAFKVLKIPRIPPRLVPAQKKKEKSFLEAINTTDDDHNGMITLLFVGRSPEDDSISRRVAGNFLNTLLFGAPTAILNSKMRKDGIAYSVDSSGIALTSSHIDVVHIISDAQKTPVAVFEILKCMKACAEGRIPVRDFESTRKYVVSVLSTSLETVSDLIGWYSRDILSGRKLTSPSEEIAIIQNLSIEDVAQAAKRTYLNSSLYGAIACPDASFWTDDILRIRDASTNDTQDELEARIKTSRQDILQDLESNANNTGLFWAAYYILNFLTLATAMYVSQLPLKGGNRTVSLFDYSYDLNPLFGVLFFAPMFVAAVIISFANGRYRAKALRWAIGANVLAALVFLWGLVYAFGDIGIDNQPWTEDIASVLQPLFFFILVPIGAYKTIHNLLRVRPKEIVADLVTETRSDET